MKDANFPRPGRSGKASPKHLFDQHNNGEPGWKPWKFDPRAAILTGSPDEIP
jgi:hypothetical protein